MQFGSTEMFIEEVQSRAQVLALMATTPHWLRRYRRDVLRAVAARCDDAACAADRRRRAGRRAAAARGAALARCVRGDSLAHVP